jgi:hypothetical protein
MKLGGKSKDVDSFVDQLKSEGEHVTSGEAMRSSLVGSKQATKAAANQPLIKTERYVATRCLNCILSEWSVFAVSMSSWKRK